MGSQLKIKCPSCGCSLHVSVDSPARLSTEAKRYIVKALARDESPSEVAEAVRKKFGIVVTRQGVEFYDPRKKHAARAGLSNRWTRLFWQSRAEFTGDESPQTDSPKTF